MILAIIGAILGCLGSVLCGYLWTIRKADKFMLILFTLICVVMLMLSVNELFGPKGV